MHRIRLFLLPLVLLLLVGCNPLKYVPKDKYLLQSVRIEPEKGLKKDNEWNIYLSQVPNERFLGIINLNLFWYNLSGKDTSKFINRTLRKIGQEPVIYDEGKNERSRITLEKALVNKGYFNCEVQKNVEIRKRRAYVTLHVKGNTPYRIRNFEFVPARDSISNEIVRLMPSSTLKPGMLLGSAALEAERERLTTELQKRGYYGMRKEYLEYNADSSLGTNQADLVMVLKSYTVDTSLSSRQSEREKAFGHPRYRIRNVYFMLEVPMSAFVRGVGPNASQGFDFSEFDTISQGAYHTVYRNKPFISPEALISNCRIVPGELYDAETVERTYARMNSLQYMKYINIRFSEDKAGPGGERPLDCYIVMTQSLRQGLSMDIEGTNTAGDFGIAGNISYTHRNVLNGSELLQAKIRGAYEALSTDFNIDYTELGGELNFLLPEFKMPFLSTRFKQSVDATTELSTSYQLMSRYEFERTVASVGARYNWSKEQLRQTIDLIDLSYTYMPRVNPAFQATYLNDSSYLKYSYEDHFILRSAYSFSYSSVPFGSSARNYHTLRGSLESAGNVLYGAYALLGASKDDGFYKIGKINFAQYLKGEIEYAKSIGLTNRSRIAYRMGLGLAYPYGNSTILPFEKRFYSGGANSIRGWSVRTLGPGSYNNGSRTIDFMNQSGDMKLDLSLEYRGNLFWVVEGALFADAGNIWTLRDYEEQAGGQFRFDTFYKQMAASIGAGIRLNFDFFLIRVDLGMKVYDPSVTATDHWRIRHIDNVDDFALHFAIGYPF